MTNDKAREFFSAYHEGTLEPGLTASLERSLRADPALQSEYDAFVATVESLDALRTEAIEIPAYLSERVAARLQPVLDVRPVPFWRAWLAPFNAAHAPRPGWALAAAGALLVSSIWLRHLRVTDTQNAGLFSGAEDAVTWDTAGAALTAHFAGSSERTVSVRSEDGTTKDLHIEAGRRLDLTLANPNAGARRFDLSVAGRPLATVFVPGTRVGGARTGSGSVNDLSAALANLYRTPVVVRDMHSATELRWTLEGTDARAAVEKVLGEDAHAVLLTGNVLQIGQ